ncbi:peptidoglycan/LPS O-acetylase OafA/YrhL [Methanomicrobium sp. W14]|uniref:acyltransferase family protein n=1 Tax=Methanomicrobium sp. W14 TaxID=2817839 RepID=UPI001AE86962|nr:acyltransferase [Methanomicrobium sp. W14]MBP2132903.1 peptidoglycan/LPS O-acetylase OafA/YrhL [Methanomicrobium sp. W14]
MNARFTNNFDFLRFFAASLIIFSHSFALILGYANIFIFDWHLLVGQLGLAVLLAISGYLIPGSWERKPDLKIFFKKRGLRIFPGLIASIVFIIFFIGPVVTSLSLHEYFSRLLSPLTWLSVPFYINGSVLGLFPENPVTYVNAPLWAIPFEFFLYAVVAVAGIFGILSKKRSMIPFMAITFLLWVLWYDNPALNKIRFAMYFFTGAYLYMNRNKIRYHPAFVFILWVFVILSYGSPFMFAFAFIAVPYTVIWFAQLPTKRLNRFGKYGDFSFGLFIYAYPIQQTIIHFLPDIEIPSMIILSYTFSIPAAVASWYLIERHALSLKDPHRKSN